MDLKAIILKYPLTFLELPTKDAYYLLLSVYG